MGKFTGEEQILLNHNSALTTAGDQKLKAEE